MEFSFLIDYLNCMIKQLHIVALNYFQKDFSQHVEKYASGGFLSTMKNEFFCGDEFLGFLSGHFPQFLH